MSSDYYNFTRLVLQKIAQSFGMTYEQLTDDFMSDPKQPVEKPWKGCYVSSTGGHGIYVGENRMSDPKQPDVPQTGDAIAGRFYVHGKSGDRYLCLGVGYNSNNTLQEDGRIEVYYRGPSGLMHNRALSEWSQEVEWPDGTIRPRFSPLE
jgi:hypothetical protein